MHRGLSYHGPVSSLQAIIFKCALVLLLDNRGQALWCIEERMLDYLRELWAFPPWMVFMVLIRNKTRNIGNIFVPLLPHGSPLVYLYYTVEWWGRYNEVVLLLLMHTFGVPSEITMPSTKRPSSLGLYRISGMSLFRLFIFYEKSSEWSVNRLQRSSVLTLSLVIWSVHLLCGYSQGQLRIPFVMKFRNKCN